MVFFDEFNLADRCTNSFFSVVTCGSQGINLSVAITCANRKQYLQTIP